MYALRITRADAVRRGDDAVEADGAVPYELAIEAAGSTIHPRPGPR
jgi:hypothetical protein